MKSLRSIRRENDSAARRRRRSSRVWVPRVGWLSPAQQRALLAVAVAAAVVGGDLTATVEWPQELERTLRCLERHGLILIYPAHVRLTAEGIAVVRGWQEADR